MTSLLRFWRGRRGRRPSRGGTRLGGWASWAEDWMNGCERTGVLRTTGLQEKTPRFPYYPHFLVCLGFRTSRFELCSFLPLFATKSVGDGGKVRDKACRKGNPSEHTRNCNGATNEHRFIPLAVMRGICYNSCNVGNTRKRWRCMNMTDVTRQGQPCILKCSKPYMPCSAKRQVTIKP